MRNWQTTIIGALLAGGYVLQDVLVRGASLQDWKTWIVPVLLAVLGFVAKDARVSGPPVILGALLLLLPSCALNPVSGKYELDRRFRISGTYVDQGTGIVTQGGYSSKAGWSSNVTYARPVDRKSGK